MNILLALIPVTILILVVAGVAFFWAADHGQFDDLDTPALMPLLDPPDAPPPSEPAAAAPARPP